MPCLASFISEKVICPKIRFFLITLLTITAPVMANHPVADVVTMRNGDIHIGKVKQANFLLETGFGLLDFSIQDIKHIKFPAKTPSAANPSTSLARITALSGEYINGELLQSSVDISRLQDPGLPIQLENVNLIDIGTPHQQPSSKPFRGRLETRSSDMLFVKPGFDALQLKTEAGVHRIERTQLLYLDAVLRTDEDTTFAQASLIDGHVIQGVLIEDPLPLVSAYQQAINISAQDISRLNLSQESQQPEKALVFSDPIPKLGTGPEMVVIPAGHFLKGDHQDDGDFDEKPLAEVKLKAFAIGRFEVTFAQYDLFCRQTRCNLPDDQDWGRGERPVMNVSWNHALAYTEWLSEKTGKPYRLPSDAEWEYAHRAGEMTRYAWGNEVESARANCEGCGSLWDGDQTAPVGRFPANAFGLHDTAGNVFEWVADCFHDRFADAPFDGSPIEKKGCGKRVIRGGAWSFPPRELRSANRWRDFPSRRSDDTGFRVALDL